MSKTNSGVRVMVSPVSRTRSGLPLARQVGLSRPWPPYDTAVPAELLTGMRLARAAIGRGELVVIPTDTVYGVAADAFSPAAVAPPARGEGSRPHGAAARARSRHPDPRCARRVGARRGARPGRRVLAGRTHDHPARPPDARLGSRRDPRHGRAAHAERHDRARAARRDRPARGLERQPHRRAGGDHGGRGRGDARRLASRSTSTAGRSGAAYPGAEERAGLDDRRRDRARSTRTASCASCGTASSRMPRSSASWGPTECA